MFKYLVLIIILTIIAPVFSSADQVFLNPTDDAYVWEFYPDNNYGNEDSIYAGYYNGCINALLEFDLSSYAGATINSANLRLYVYDSVGAFPTDQIMITRNDADWDEGSATWNNKPGFAEFTNITAPGTYDWWETDVTNWVQDIIDGTDPNYGFQILKDDAGANATFTMRSKEYSSNHPELVLDYTPSVIESASLGEIKAAFK